MSSELRLMSEEREALFYHLQRQWRILQRQGWTKRNFVQEFDEFHQRLAASGFPLSDLKIQTSELTGLANLASIARHGTRTAAEGATDPIVRLGTRGTPFQ